jgi:NAD(P)H dehydrogenase (quinone)
MHCLVVLAHPLADSLCAALARTAVAALERGGHGVELVDLYHEGFAPALSAAERASYYDGPYARGGVEPDIARLQSADAIVLVFPTWWFSLPAMLKGWFDRVWAPGAAYDHADDLGPIRARLGRLRHAMAITTLGSPWWVDRLVMRRPVRAVLKTALFGTCAPQCRFEMQSFYRCERLSAQQVQALCARVDARLARWNQ